MVNGEVGSTEFVRGMEERNSRKKRKRIKGNDLVDSSSGMDLSKVEHGVGSSNRIEAGNFNSPNERSKKKKRKKHGNDQMIMNEELGDAGAVVREDKENGGKGRSGIVNLNCKASNDKEEAKEKKKRKKNKKKKVKHNIDTEAILKEARVGNNEADGKDIRYNGDSHGEPAVGNSEKEEDKKKKKDKDKDKKTTQLVLEEPILQECSVGDDEAATKELENTEYSKDRTKDKKKQTIDVGKRVEINTDAPEISPLKSTSKRVSFDEDLEVLTSSNDLVRGKRFTPEEDKLVQAACWEYVYSKDLGDEGIQMILNCRTHKRDNNCWKEICAAIPWRPRESVRYRAHILFERGESRKWTEEEREIVMKHYKKHGANWKPLAEAFGKTRLHVKNTHRRFKFENLKKGRWTQDEVEQVYDLVNTNLKMKAFEERKSKHGMFKDNICWGAISEKLKTRNHSHCSQKWYRQLASPMVQQKKWFDMDDYYLVIELYNLDACCMEDVDWDCLLEHRSGDVCRKRWNEMVKHLGDCSNKSFSEQVEILAKRYTPDVLEAREAYYTKPVVD